MRKFPFSFIAVAVGSLFSNATFAESRSEEERDLAICKEREAKIYQLQDGAPIFGIELLSSEESGLDRRRTFTTLFEYQTKVVYQTKDFFSSHRSSLNSHDPNRRTVPSVALLVECQSNEQLRYSEDPTYCILPIVEEVLLTEAWKTLIAENAWKTRFRTICQRSYSEVERQLFFFDQDNFQTERKSAVLWDYIGRQAFGHEIDKCVQERRLRDDYREIEEERNQVLEDTKYCRRKNVRLVGPSFDEYDFSKCSGEINLPDHPKTEAQSFCYSRLKEEPSQTIKHAKQMHTEASN